MLASLALATTVALAADDHADMAKRDTDWIYAQIAKAPDGGETGEQVAWNWNASLNNLTQAIKNWPTDAWMAPAEKIHNAIIDKMATGPDGYRGFIGPYIYNGKEYWCDVHVGDALLWKHILTFSEVVHDNPELKANYGASARKFVDTAKRELIEKWEKRSTFHVDGPFAGYHEWNQFCKPGELDKWFTQDDPRNEGCPIPSVPFNKDMHMAECMLQIYRVTGDETYRDKAQKVFDRFKAALNRFDGAYTWNYWEPTSPKDIDNIANPNNKILTHWVDAHPHRPYMRGEVAMCVYAYDCGVTFTEEDIRKLIRTNLHFMWNGDKENPTWRNCTAFVPGCNAGEPSPGGSLWPSLAPFDATIRELYAATLKENDIIARAALDKLPPPSFKRKYKPDAVVEDFPWMKDVKESKGQTVALVIPSVVEADQSTVILSKANAPRSEAKIYVRPAAGGERHLIAATPRPLGQGEQFAHEWDGKIDGKRLKGDYVIIWEYMDGERAFPVTLK